MRLKYDVAQVDIDKKPAYVNTLNHEYTVRVKWTISWKHGG
jgi:hypothetical protein